MLSRGLLLLLPLALGGLASPVQPSSAPAAVVPEDWAAAHNATLGGEVEPLHRLARRIAIDRSCDAHNAAMSNAYNQAKAMISAALGAVNTIVAMLQDPTQAYARARDPATRAIWDTFCAMFGGLATSAFPLKPSDPQTAAFLARALYVQDVFDKMNTRLSGPHAAIHDEFWCTDAWLTPTDPEGRRNALPNLLWDNRPTRPDALKDGWVNVGDDGTCDGDTSAFTITHIWGGDIDVITFCQDRFAQWDQDQAQGRTVQDLCAAAQPQGTALDAVVGGKLATVMVHEFTHSLNLVQQKPTDTGESPITDQTCPGTTDRPAYGFGCIAALGRDKSQLAINNADSYAYFAAAAYCRRNNWFNGFAQPL